MPKESDELGEEEVAEIMASAKASVASQFDPVEHLPKHIYELVQPICAAT